MVTSPFFISDFTAFHLPSFMVSSPKYLSTLIFSKDQPCCLDLLYYSLFDLSLPFVLLFTFKRFNTEVYHNTLFPSGSDGRESACNVGDLGLIPGLGRSPGEGIGYPLQYSCLENPMDRGV